MEVECNLWSLNLTAFILSMRLEVFFCKMF